MDLVKDGARGNADVTGGERQDGMSGSWDRAHL